MRSRGVSGKMYSIREKDILRELLDRYERSRTYRQENQRSQTFSIRPEQVFPAYQSDYTSIGEVADFENELDRLEQEDLIRVKKRGNTAVRSEEAAVENMLAEHHTIEDNPQPLVKERPARRQVAESEVFIAPYDANQFYYIQYSDRGEKFDVANDPAISMYNSYFGSGMNAIVFQEMREARGLAYSASAFLSSPPYADDDYMFYAFIASQNDKLKDAVEAFDQIINNMPESEEAFQVAKTSILSRLRTSRTTGMGVLNKYVALRDLGLSEDRDKAIFEKIQNMTLADVKAFQEKWIKDRSYAYGLLGRESDFDMDFARSLGPVTSLTLEEIFGY